MIARLKGTVVELQGQYSTVDVQGVGYEVLCSKSCFEDIEIGSTITLTIYTDVREDCISLYGFSDRLEKQVFLMLKTVKGVGSKMASFILSEKDKLEILRAIGSSDITTLQSIKGVGKKTAERIIVELKEKVSAYAVVEGGIGLSVDRTPERSFEDALQGMRSLGFSAQDAKHAISKVDRSVKDSADIIREALQHI